MSATSESRQVVTEERNRPNRAAISFGLPARFTAEFLGTAFLLAAVVGSGIMGERLAGGNVAIALLANTLATGTILVVLIMVFGPISNGHFNPAVTLSLAAGRVFPWRDVPIYLGAQFLGAFAGVMTAHLMFGSPLFSLSVHVRHGIPQMWSEFVATFGLLCVVWASIRFRIPGAYAVGAYITSAYWFTASTSFANPAVTVARAASNTFAGIRPEDVPAFLIAQLIGAGFATALFQWIAANRTGSSPEI
jgi:glycerol uptake facilitator-like aquaporin